MATVADIMDAMAAQISGRLGTAYPHVQVVGRLWWNPTPDPACIDVYPGDPFTESTTFGDGQADVTFTVRARVNTPDSDGAQDVLLALMDVQDEDTSVRLALQSDTTLGGQVADSVVSGPSEYQFFSEPNGGTLLGCVWGVRAIL